MLTAGCKIKFMDKEAIVLAWLENEALIYVDEHCIKWVDKDLLQMLTPAFS